MKKFTYKFLGLTWLGGMLFIGSASGQQGPTSYSATSSAATSTVNNSISGFGTTTFPSANSYTVRYGEAGASTAGLNRTVNEFVLGGQTFVRLPRASSPFDQVTVKRRPNPVVVDPQRTALFFESPTAAAPATVVASGTPLYLSSNVVTSYESALNSYIVNRGAENLFTNTNVTTGTSNVERLDLILNKGFTVKNTTTEGFLLLERGGDDTFKYAAITELDVFGNVKTLGALKTFSNTSNWSNTGINFKSTVVQKNSTDALQRPSGNVAAEEVKGTFLTMQDLGISAGTTFFGIVIFHSDVTSSMDLIGLTDIPVNSGASLDLVGGSGIFSVPTVVNNICPTLTANLTSAFTTTNLPSGTVLTWHSGFPATNANRIANPAAVSNGLYYPAYFSSSLNCYSDAGIPVRVTIINCPPLAQNDNAETFANTPVNINVRLNDSDPEGLPLNNPTIISNPANGTVQVQANGTITYTPSPAFTGTNTFQYQVCDQGSPSLCATATVTVLVKNARIVANNDVSPQQNGASGGVAINTVLANDSLSNVPVVANLVTISAVGSVPSQLTFNTSTGQVSVNPGTPAGTYGFTYKICEIANPTNCDDATVSVPVGVAPIVAVDDTNPTAINGATGGVAIANVRTNDLLNGVPVTSSNVTTTLVGTLPAQLTFNPSTGQVSVNPGSAAGTYTFTYKICEVLNPTNCDEALVSVLVGVAPILAVDDTNPTAINGATGGVAIANVRTNDLLNGVPVTSSNVTTTLVGTLPAQLTFNPSTGQVSVNPGTASGTYTFDYKICEVLNPTNCDEAKVTVQVGAAAILAQPDVSIIPINGNTGGVSELVIFSNDLLNGVPFMSNQVILTSTPAGPLTMNPNGIISVAPNTLTGQYSMIYQICEVLNPTNCDTALVTVRVVAPPVAQPDIALTLINTPISGDVTLNDSDIDPNDVLSTTVLSNPTNGTVVLNSNGTYTYSPNTNFTGKDTFCYVLSDGLSTDTTCVTITVQPRPIRENNPPIAANDAVETYVNVPVSVAILGNDVDPDGVLSNSPSILLAPKNGSASVLPSGQVLYTPSTGFVGTDSLYYKICDTGIPTRCDSAWVYILIKPSILGNLPPVAVDDFNTTVQDTPVNGTVAANDYDLDNNPLTFQTVTSPAQGTVILQPNGSYQYTPNAGFTGVDTFRYKTCDVSACDTATVFITVTPALKVRLFPRVYLQGALYGILLPDTLMRDRLRELSLIPATSPYAYLSPVTPTGAVNSSVFTVTGQNAIVDWVFVELRDAQDSTIVVDSRAALLQRDGDLVDVDGVSPVDFSSAITTKSYFVSVRHRNHLGTMSKTALTMTRTGRLIDFRKTSTPTFVFNAQAINQAQVVVDQGVALWAGNGLMDNRIIYQGNENDVNAVYQKVISSPLNVFSTPFFKLRGYFVEDIDLNGEVIVQGTLNDVEYIYQNIIKNHPGNIFKVPFFIITEQLP